MNQQPHAGQPQASEPVKQAAAVGAELKRSADAVEQSTEQLSDSAGRRTTLAGDRTLLAAERTYAAWVRTALTALASGVGARALLEHVVPTWLAQLTGSTLILFAAFCLVAGVWRQLRDGVPRHRTHLHPFPHFILVPINGFLLIVALAALVGVWAA